MRCIFCIACALFRSCVLLAALFPTYVSADDPRARLEHLQAQDRLDLKMHQRQFQRQLPELPEARESALRRQLQQQQARQWGLHQRQQASALRHRSRVRPGAETGPTQRLQLQRFRMDQQAQQLQFKMQRRAWPYMAE